MWRTLFVVALVAVAGCATQPPGGGANADGPDGDGAVPGKTAENGSNAGRADAGNATDRRALTSVDATASPNPWGAGELTVAIDDADASRHFRPLVARALDFWATNDARYVGYPIGFDLDPDAPDPDLIVKFVDRIDSCANVSDPAGCAPFVTAGDVSRPVTIEVVGSYANESTLLVLKHELGHVLGLNHSAEPQSVMAPSSDLSTLPRPNATERRLPWRDADFSVFVDAGTTDDPGAVRAQVRRALDYYADGANGTVPANVSYDVVDDRTRADVIVAVGIDDLPCRVGDRGSCGRVHGVDPDGDDALERYDRLRITLGNVDTDAVGWHVGYWLGYGFGFDDDADWPPAFQNASYDDRRSDWWEESENR